jgi:hypothetical protein
MVHYPQERIKIENCYQNLNLYTNKKNKKNWLGKSTIRSMIKADLRGRRASTLAPMIYAIIYRDYENNLYLYKKLPTDSIIIYFDHSIF